MSKKNSNDIYSSSRKKGNKGKVAAIVIIISVIILLLAAAWVWFFNRGLITQFFPEATSEPTTTEEVTTAVQTTAEQTEPPATEAKVEVPYVIGYASKSAYDKLNSVGLRYTVVREYSEEVHADYVLRQDPAPGETIKQSEKVTLYISKGTDNPVEVTVARPLTTDPTDATQPTSGAKKKSNSGYILENSDSRYITRSELKNLSENELTLALNEIYARYGRKFNTPEIQAYFNKQSWYHGTIAPEDFDEDMINSIESANVRTILEYMREKGYR